MTYGVGRVCTGVGWGHRDSHFLKLIKRASQLDLWQLFFHYEAERKRKVTESERKGGRERERMRKDRDRVRRLVLKCSVAIKCCR